MSNLAKKIEWQTAESEAGVIAHVGEREIWVTTARGRVRAERATSCLVAPEEGDFVLFCTLGTGAAYVLAVLERERGAPIRIAPDGDVTLAAAHGRIALTARDGLDLASEAKASVTARELSVAAATSTFAVGALAYLGRTIEASAEHVRVCAGAIDTVAERLMARVKRAYRFVEDLDVKRAARIDHEASRDFRLRAEHALVTASELVKLDGQQIHLG